jgi:hypothetical protein
MILYISVEEVSMPNPVVSTLIDLATNPTLLAEFRKAPETVLANRGLSESEITALTSRNSEEIRTALHDNIRGSVTVVIASPEEIEN